MTKRQVTDFKMKKITRPDGKEVFVRHSVGLKRCNNCNTDKGSLQPYVGSKMTRILMCHQCQAALRKAGPKLVPHYAQEV